MENTGLATYGRPADEAYFSIALVSSNPTIPTTANETLTGYSTVRVSSEGVAPGVDLGKSDPAKDWAGDDILSAPSNPSATLAVPVIDHSVAAKKLKYGSSKVGVDGSYVFDGTTDAWVVVVTELHNNADGEPALIDRIVYPNCVPQELALGAHKKDELIIDTVTFKPLYDSTIGGYFKGLAPVAVTTTTTTTGA